MLRTRDLGGRGSGARAEEGRCTSSSRVASFRGAPTGRWRGRRDRLAACSSPLHRRAAPGEGGGRRKLFLHHFLREDREASRIRHREEAEFFELLNQ